MVEVGDFYVFTIGKEKYIYYITKVHDTFVEVRFIHGPCKWLFWSFRIDALEEPSHRKIDKEDIVGELL